MWRHISDTAFLVTDSRARRLDLSLDRFAELWIPPERRQGVRNLSLRYEEQVYPHDPLELGLRNRHYLRWLEHYSRIFPNGLVVLLGAGLVSYPYLLQKLRWIEVDLADVIDFKGERADILSRSGELPPMGVIRRSADLCELSAQDELFATLEDELAAGPSCVVVEGLTYYLTEVAFGRLMRTLTRLQVTDSLLLFDYWTPEALHHPVFRRQLSFFGKEMAFDGKEYHLLSHEAAARPGYRVLHQGGVETKAESLQVNEAIPDEGELLPEYSIVLQRI